MIDVRFDSDVERSPIEGVVVCAICPDLFEAESESYRLSIEKRLIRLSASDVDGMRNALFTFVQVASSTSK